MTAGSTTRRRISMLTGRRQVQVMSTLPLKGISRLWGRFNELQIPYYLRVPGFKLYSWVFGVKYVLIGYRPSLTLMQRQPFRSI